MELIAMKLVALKHGKTTKENVPGVVQHLNPKRDTKNVVVIPVMFRIVELIVVPKSVTTKTNFINFKGDKAI